MYLWASVELITVYASGYFKRQVFVMHDFSPKSMEKIWLPSSANTPAAAATTYPLRKIGYAQYHRYQNEKSCLQSTGDGARFVSK